MAGEEAMVAEIFARGPIACGVAVTPAFEQYTGGIFEDTTGAMVSRMGEGEGGMWVHNWKWSW